MKSSKKYIIVKLSINSPVEGLLRQTINNDGIWGNYKFEINNAIKECDYWFVYSKGQNFIEKCLVEPSNIFLITGEPEDVYHYANNFVKQFSEVFTTRNDISTIPVTKMHPAQPWWVGRKNGFLATGKESFPLKFHDLINSSPKKTKLISVISSNKNFTKGHIQRLEFVSKLKERFGNKIDIFGKGINDFEDKWDVLKDYKYHIVIENSAYDDYWTEKLADCFLAECYPLYFGAPNILDYFDEKSLSVININDIDSSINTISTIIENDQYSKSYEYISNSKNKILNDYNLFNEISKICDSKELNKNNKMMCQIKPEKKFLDLYKLKLLFNRFKNKLGVKHVKV